MSQQDKPIQKFEPEYGAMKQSGVGQYVKLHDYRTLEAALKVATEALELIQEQTELIKDRYAFGGERIVPTCGAYKARKALERIRKVSE